MRCQIRTVECRQNLAILGQLWPTKELEYHEYSSWHIQEQGAGMGQGLARTQPVRMSDFLKYFPILFLAKLIAPIKKLYISILKLVTGGISLIADSRGEISPSHAAYFGKKKHNFST